MTSTKAGGPTFLGLSLLWIVMASQCLAVDGTIHAILPISGTDGSRYLQWASAARIAAAQVSSQWAPNDALVIDIIDTKGSKIHAIQAAVEAGRNASVHAVIGTGSDVTTTDHVAAVLAHDSVPMLAPSCEDSMVDTKGLGLYSMTPLAGFRLNALQALLSKYSWRKIGVVYLHTDQGEHVRDQINQMPGLQTTNMGLDPLETDFVKTLDLIYRLSLNVIVVFNPDPVSAALFFQQAVDMQLYVPGRAWVYLEEGFGSANTIPTFPQGTLVIDETDGNQTSSDAFKTMLQSQDGSIYPMTGPGVDVVEASTIQAFDSVKIIALAIESALPTSNPVTRTALNHSISITSTSGYSGFISFKEDGFRAVGNSEIYVANSDGALELTMTFNNILTTVMEPTFPGMSSIVPLDDVDIIPIAIMLDFSGGNSTPFETAALLTAMEYAIFRLNNIAGLLPANKKLCAILLDDETRPSTAVQKSINLPNLGVAGVVGGMSSSISIVVQDVISAWNIPQISPGATAPQLSDKRAYPSFARIVSSAVVEGDIVIDLCRKYNWTEISILSTLDAYGSGIAQEVLTRGNELGVSIVDHTVVDPLKRSYDEPLQRLANTKPRILVMLVGIESIANVVSSMRRLEIRPLATVSTDSILLTNVTDFAHQAEVPVEWFNGWLVMGQPGGDGDLFSAFQSELASLDPLAWPGVSSIAASSPLIVSCFDACSVFADAIRRCVEDGCDPRNGTQMLPKIMETNMQILTGPLIFTAEGDRKGIFEVRNIRGGIQRAIGRWTDQDRLVLHEDVVWPDGGTVAPLAVLPRVQTWLKWSSGAGIALTVVASLGICASLLMVLVIYQQRNSPVIISSTWQFLLLMLAGAILGFGSVWVWIGRPEPYLCALRIWIPPLAFVIIISPLLAKTWRLMRIFSLTNMRVEPIPLMTLVVIVTALLTIQVIICIFWISLGTIQTEVIPDKHDKNLAYVVCKHNMTNKIASYVTFGWNGLSLASGCYLAFRVRKLPRDFNESRWIARTIYNTFLFAGLIIILGYALSSWINIVLILICVCTLAICFGSIALIMAPKLWELYIHPERRSSSSSQGRSGDSTRMTTRRSTRGGGSTISGRSKTTSASDRDSKNEKSVSDYSRQPGAPSTVLGSNPKSKSPVSSPSLARRANSKPSKPASSSSSSEAEAAQNGSSSTSSSSSSAKEEI